MNGEARQSVGQLPYKVTPEPTKHLLIPVAVAHEGQKTLVHVVGVPIFKEAVPISLVRCLKEFLLQEGVLAEGSCLVVDIRNEEALELLTVHNKRPLYQRCLDSAY